MSVSKCSASRGTPVSFGNVPRERRVGTVQERFCKGVEMFGSATVKRAGLETKLYGTNDE